MVRTTDRDSVIEHALGSLGLFLLGLIGWAVERLQGRSPIDAVMARLVLGCVTSVGWVIDRLPLPDSHRRARDDSTAILKIRRALRGSRESSRFVETVPGKGYRFAASVEVVPPSNSDPLAETRRHNLPRSTLGN
jgi:hypothetical protein